jgi:hypothetical protein
MDARLPVKEAPKAIAKKPVDLSSINEAHFKMIGNEGLPSA